MFATLKFKVFCSPWELVQKQKKTHYTKNPDPSKVANSFKDAEKKKQVKKSTPLKGPVIDSKG